MRSDRSTILVLGLAYAVLWLIAKPAGADTVSYLGQWCGAESILLLSIALVLISTLPWVEVWFDGIDRAAIWHRRVAMTGMVLLIPHVLLSSGEGGGGGLLGLIGLLGLLALVVWAILPRWQSVVPRPLRPLIVGSKDVPGIATAPTGLRRLRALAGAAPHHRTVRRCRLRARPARRNSLRRRSRLRWSLVAIGGVGLGFYVYRELLARFFSLCTTTRSSSVREVDQRPRRDQPCARSAGRWTSSPASSR